MQLSIYTPSLARKGELECGMTTENACISSGYAPPDSIVPTTLVPVTNDPSANYGPTRMSD